MLLDNKNAVIYGAAGAVGSAVTQLAREHGAYAVLVVNSTGQKIKVELDHDFSLPDEPGQTYRILDIRPTQVVIKRMRDGEVWTLQKTSG